MSVALTANFVKNARGLTLKDSASVTWTINANTNEISAAATGASGGVTSVGLSDGSTTPVYVITGSPVTSTGVLTFTLKNQNANLVLAGPASGGAAQPTFRGLVVADIPALAYVTSVGLADGSTTPIYSISGSPVTSSGTLTFTLATQSANLVFAGPTTGAAAQPAFRALVAADVPSSILPGSFSGFANPTAKVALAAANGTATTAMRSDGAPALDVTISPTWTGNHTFLPGSGIAVTIEAPSGTTSFRSGVLTQTNNPRFELISTEASGLTEARFTGSSNPNGAISVGSTQVIVLGNSRTVTINAPASGPTLTVNQLSGNAGVVINGAAVSPSANRCPVSVVSGQFLYQYQQIALQSTDRMVLVGTARAIVSRLGTDYLPGAQGEAFEGTGQVVRGRPKTPNVNFVVPTEFICDLFRRLNLIGALRATLQGTANLVIDDDFGTRSRITLAGTGY